MCPKFIIAVRLEQNFSPCYIYLNHYYICHIKNKYIKAICFLHACFRSQIKRCRHLKPQTLSLPAYHFASLFFLQGKVHAISGHA